MAATSTADEDDLVAHWAIRLDGVPLSHDEQEALDAWLEEDERRQGALLRAQATLAYIDRGRALSVSHAAPEPVTDAPKFGRRRFLAGGLLSGLAAASVGGFLLFSPSVDTVQTSIGEVRRMPLADGSVAAVNTNSRLAVAIGKEVRRVRLERGEAFFQVAHDRARPFIVEAGQIRVQAVGTAFSVRRHEGGAEILVTEGVVETWLAGQDGTRKRISAGGKGMIADASNSIDVKEAPREVDRALAWRSGEIAVDGETLAYAVAEINRYNKRQLVIDDAELAREPLVGYFRTNEPENFGRAVASMMDARVVERGDTIHLVREPS